MIREAELSIRAMTTNDFHIMVKWLSNEKVLQYYEEPRSDLNRVINKYGPRIKGEHYVTPCIVEYRNEPIGYIQYYKIQETELIKYELSKNKTNYGIDQFIGEPELWGRGIGTSMIRMMLEYLWENKGASKVVLEVKKKNQRAIASYSKCGFKQSEELDHECILMEWIKEVE